MAEPAIQWLLDSDEPGIRHQARRDLLGEDPSVGASDVLAGPLVSRLLGGQQPDGGFGVHPYHKWTGAHWRLVSLVELGVPAGVPPVAAALDSVLSWLASSGDPDDALTIRGLARVHGSIYANALAVATRLGRADDKRVRDLAAWLVMWQWPDGGWNCDRHRDVTHSSFYESITPMWALAEFARASGDRAADDAARRATEFFLDHRVFKSHRSDRPGAIGDERCSDALSLLRQQQQDDGRWLPAGPQYWKGASGPYGDPAHWSADSAGRMLTLNALRVLRAAGAN
jgi:hypothetical protein